METAESRSGIMSHCIGGVMATIQSYFQLKLRVRRKQNKSVIDVINVKNNKNKRLFDDKDTILFPSTHHP